jgi:rubrerythrin
MLGDEKKHLARLRRRWNELLEDHREVLEAPLFLHFDFNALQEIFPSREEISRSLSVNLTEDEALKLAMNMERDAFNFFSQYADKFNDTRGRDIFLQFAEEEQEHYEIIRKTYEKSR